MSAALFLLAALQIAASSGEPTMRPAPADPQPADPQPGISRALALERAGRLSDLQYDLRFSLSPQQDTVEAEVSVQFRVREGTRDVVLDFAGLSLQAARLDGEDLGPELRQVHGHLVLPAARSAPGVHIFQARVTASVAPTGAPLTVYRDSASQSEFFYTLLVPADAHRLFPCFDQPDLKAEYRLQIDAPADWVAVGNAPLQSSVELSDSRRRHRFAPTRPISTYLFAFAAGPFDVHELGSQEGGPPIRVLSRPQRTAELDLPALEQLHRRSLNWLQDYFAVPYPFQKLDAVLCPGFPYGGMEHPGAIFYRETSLVFDHEASRAELLRRSTLIYHEVSHQWFGNLVTMRWFDDLWLKEGFATFMAYAALEELEPASQAWLRFHQGVKPSAYRVDASPGTTPVYQALGNLFDAKSQYGPIVYNKAPAILRELEARLGRDAFRSGVTAFLQRYSFANADWRELIACLQEHAEQDLGQWAERWITAPGMPTVRVQWEQGEDGQVSSFEIRQSSAQEGVWPINVRLLMATADGEREQHRFGLINEATRIASLEGRPAPRWVLLNPLDVEYGQFLLDARSIEGLMQDLPAERDPLLRSTGFTALWDAVREAELDPARFLQQVGLPMLEAETDPLTHGRFLGAVSTAIDRYVADSKAPAFQSRLLGILEAQLAEGRVPGQELGLFRRLARMSALPGARQILRQTLDGTRRDPGLQLGLNDRFAAVGALLAVGDEGAEERLRALQESAERDVAREVYVAGAARPDAETKRAYFEGWLNPDDPPEQWISASLSTFHWPGQEALCRPYLRPALEQVEWVKEHRKIFFMPAWIDRFVNAHRTPEARDEVRDFLEQRELSADVRRKLLQSLSELERCVRIREVYGAD